MTEAITAFDCYSAACYKATIIACQRKINRLLGWIAEKERFAARYRSRQMCQAYDRDIETLLYQVAELESSVMASELGLEQFEAKRREEEAQRLARLLHISAPTLDPAAPTKPTPPATQRTEQLTIFGPGPAKLDTTPSGSQVASANRTWAVESGLAVGFEHLTDSADAGQDSHHDVILSPAVTPKSEPVMVTPAVTPKSEPVVVTPAASTPASTPVSAPQTERAAPEAAKLTAQTAQQIPFTFAYAFDPPKPDSQSPNSQSPDSQSPNSQSPNSQSPVVVAKESVEVPEVELCTSSDRSTSDDQRPEEECQAATLFALLQNVLATMKTTDEDEWAEGVETE